MNRRNFLRSLALGVAGLYIRVCPEVVAVVDRMTHAVELAALELKIETYQGDFGTVRIIRHPPFHAPPLRFPTT